MNRSFKSIASLVLFAIAACHRHKPVTVELPQSASRAVHPGVWVRVDTRADTLSVLDGNTEIYHVDNIAFGSGGAGRKIRRGDRITPLGVFRVTRITSGSRFRVFIALNYPSPEYVRSAFEENRIDDRVLRKFVDAFSAGQPPPQDTLLGGLIGIHGLGRANRDVHRLINWTDGCVAVENEQIERLATLLKVGSLVEIR